MQSSSQQISTCPNCGAALEETSGGGGGCKFCLLQAGIGSQEETVHDSTPAPLEGGVRFGVYEIDCHADGSLCELGRGAMGVTYRATDTSLQRKVALKIIKTDIAERSADARERFVREARAAAALRHEHIATVYQFGVRLETGQHFYAMELIEGETLEERVRRAGLLDARTTIGIAEQVTSALATAEKQGLVHRDLKPANLMLVDPDDPEVMGSDHARSKRSRIRALRKSGIPVVKIIDFGLAKAFHSATDPKSLTHDKFVGTPAFASPEQFEHSALDVRSDIYSLGETLWFALTGKTPFAGRTPSEIHRAQKSNVLPTEQLKVAHVPHRLKSLLESMLAFEPASRPGTSELAARLQRCSPEARSVRRTRAGLAAGFILILGATGFFAFRSLHTQSVGLNPPVAEKSIAVLPFENLSDQKQNAFFTDGVQDEILTDLAKVADLKVISRTSVMQYKSGVKRNLREIANALGVAHVVEGSVQRAANRVRVSAQLIDARTDTHLWAEHYDRDITDVFALESDLAQQIVSKLKAKLSPQEKTAIEQQPTGDLVAYEFYRQAQGLDDALNFDAKVNEHLPEAARLLQEAVRRDPDFFIAYCLLARIHDEIYFWGIDQSPARLAQAQSALDSARRLRPDAGESHLAVAQHLYWGYRNYAGAEQELAIAAQALPNERIVFELLAYMERRQGRWDASTHLFQRALELDPRNLSLLQQVAMTYQYLRRFADAAAVLDRALSIAPNNAGTRLRRAEIELWWRADPKPIEAVFATVLLQDPTTASDFAAQLLDLALCERNSEKAQRALTALDAGDSYENSFPHSHAFFEGLVARLCGDLVAAREAFTRARAELENILRQQPSYAEGLSMLGLIDAGLGDREQAVREARRAAELLPVTKDSINGSIIIEQSALTHAWLGENDLALAELDTAARLPGRVSYGYLKLHPMWDPLRGDPRFEKIVASFTPDVKAH